MSANVKPEALIRRNPQVVARQLADPEGGVLLHLESGAYHRFNPVGFAIWECLEEERSVAQIVEAMQGRILNAPPGLEADVVAFLQAALERDLVLLRAN